MEVVGRLRNGLFQGGLYVCYFFLYIIEFLNYTVHVHDAVVRCDLLHVHFVPVYFPLARHSHLQSNRAYDFRNSHECSQQYNRKELFPRNFRHSLTENHR